MKTIMDAIVNNIEVPAPQHQVWLAWTTSEGVKSFFAEECKLDLRVGGAYEMYFNMEAPTGEWGGEGCVILALEPESMLSFTWNAPPEFPTIREQRTHVVVRLKAIAEKKTLVTLSHDGWGEGEDWQQVREYFVRAWGKIVLPRLVKRFSEGPMQW
jgi:uncharacterized protein YndB with AHSA1/START domain